MPDISIVKFQSRWQAEFIEIASHLRSILGSQALRIDHIGSTSVSGLAAKDIIDIQITVDDLETTNSLTLLKSAGFRLREQITHDLLVGLNDDSEELAKRFFREQPDARRAHIHIRQAGRINQLYPLIFRDYLRSDVIVRDAYSAVKHHLARYFPNDIEAYYDIKDPYMDTIYQAAKLWGRIQGWQMDADFI